MRRTLLIQPCLQSGAVRVRCNRILAKTQNNDRQARPRSPRLKTRNTRRKKKHEIFTIKSTVWSVATYRYNETVQAVPQVGKIAHETHSKDFKKHFHRKDDRK